MDNTEEFELIEQARAGSREAFGRLVERYGKPLVGFARGRGVRPSNCEDLAQEVWIKVWGRIQEPSDNGGYDDTKGKFYTWVIKCFAHYEILRYLSAQPVFRAWAGPSDEQDGEQAQESSSGFEPFVEEELQVRFAAYCELLRLTLLCGGYPHEQIAFVLAKLVYGSESERATEGVPQYVDQIHGAVPLDTLAPTSWDAYLTATGIGDSSRIVLMQDATKPVRLRLDLKVAELIKPLPSHLEDLQTKKVARTCLRDYHARDLEAEGTRNHPITYWCYRVRQKMRRVLGLADNTEVRETVESMAGELGEGPVNPEHCRRCKLRAVPPCGQSG